MQTTHNISFTDSTDLSAFPGRSVDLVVTSPPYPMIQMWDDSFAKANPSIGTALKKEDGGMAFEFMHRELDKTWAEVDRLLKPDGICCINIGDAVRTVGGEFQLFPNHSRIIQAFFRLGFTMVPSILWRKPTNSPTKFMGSGMLPAGAYVTLEHEHILIFRKTRRKFTSSKERDHRRNSAFFWEERNRWFSDIWLDLVGTSQNLKGSKKRQRSAAFPLELPYRLILMFSVQGDLVLDPFLGTGTASVSALIAGRNSLGIERDSALLEDIEEQMESVIGLAKEKIVQRLKDHRTFVKKRLAEKGPLKHKNNFYHFPVVTAQERDLCFLEPVKITKLGVYEWRASYKKCKTRKTLQVKKTEMESHGNKI